ncbi:MAG: hypothetical protein K1060chlam5_01042 [Candidatus Anoxychlamydiales bacterium]|nr:hypothetical protein [Candidatus Anoxychlamydiales bacterium]
MQKIATIFNRHFFFLILLGFLILLKPNLEASMYQAVYAYPILPGKTETLRQIYQDQRKKTIEDNFKQDRLAYNKEMGWEIASAWIQHLPGEDWHILFIKSKEPIVAENLCSKFRKLCEKGSKTANTIRSSYIETCGRDFCNLSSWVTFEPVLDIQVPFSPEELEGRIITEYAYILPILPNKKEAFVKYLRENITNQEKYRYFQEVRKKVGIIEWQMWIQHDFERDVLVMRSIELDTISDFCNAWNNIRKNEEAMREHTEITASATGLSPKDLIANLEKL